MRKKDLINENTALFKKLEEARQENDILKKQMSKTEEELSALKAELEELKDGKNGQNILFDEPQNTPAFQKMREQICERAALPEDSEYGSKIIGEIVLLAAKYSTRLGTDPKNRELVNLILGKTEVAKADILSIVSGNENLDTKKIKINGIKKEVEDYFQSVMAQDM